MARGYDSNGQSREGFFNLTRRMDNEEEDQFDVDHTILDFLVYKTTATVFEWQASANKWESDLPDALVTMTAEWRSFLSKKHQGRRLSSQAAFRSRLLQFVLLLTHRYHPSTRWTDTNGLHSLRDQNMRRGKLWASTQTPDPILPLEGSYRVPGDELLFAREQRMAVLSLPTSFDIGMFNDSDHASLHDLLPLFVELTAARASLGDEWQPTSGWFDLAGQFMLQAVIDEYLIHRQCSTAAFTSIFAFGSSGIQREDVEGADIRAVRNVFCRDGYALEELPEWTRIRRRYVIEARAIATLENIESRHSYVKFEDSLVSFLQHLHDTAVKPDLIQVEEGRINIDGNELSERKSREMIKRMRL
ncbi:hypothetical protein BU25DRAFT_456369 [Macroventuria anomochaeta]|uniref:Uncharacterized protein n=1 Tax=Macroventuria anomochaeta TaxID=301207 RepID=A0ACB6S9B9_9PLEO|nr:uncharacterized protein BU25DRAFT_456369 [Macroventuria anomochaeta]KAF2629948.1 hypothetical protein BU25DRAFT_456369 [Macroventuria anomochaeta]